MYLLCDFTLSCTLVICSSFLHVFYASIPHLFYLFKFKLENRGDCVGTLFGGSADRGASLLQIERVGATFYPTCPLKARVSGTSVSFLISPLRVHLISLAKNATIWGQCITVWRSGYRSRDRMWWGEQLFWVKISISLRVFTVLLPSALCVIHSHLGCPVPSSVATSSPGITD